MNEKKQTDKQQRSSRRKIAVMYGIIIFLFILLVVLGIISYMQWRFLKELVATAVDLIEAEVLREAPEEVNRDKIKNTFNAIREAVPKGKVDFGKARAAANYAQKARSDERWTAKEIETLLHLMNTSLKIDKEE